MALIGDRVGIVASLLGGRTDLNANISQWIANAYRELANSLPFETLELTANTQTLANIDTVDYPVDARAIKSITIGVPVSNPISFRPLYKKNMAIIDRYAPSPTGIPSVWGPFAQQVVLRQVPNDAYPLIIRYWQLITLDPSASTAVINVTPIQLPADWIEILDYAAQMRGYIDLQESDRAAAIHVLLYGDPNPRKKQPGLIKQKLTRIQSEYENSNYGVRPRLTRYCFTR